VDHDLDALLESAAQPGEAHFTLDPRRAREQLAQHALHDPYTYVLKLVQWAVTSEARSIDVTIAGDRLEFSHDGPQPEPLGPEAHLHKGNFDLALALATVERLHARVSYDGPAIVIEGVKPSFRLQNLAAVQLGAGWWQRLKTWLRPEAALLRLRCVYCPAALSVNGEPVNRPLAGLRHSRTPLKYLGNGPLHGGCSAFIDRVPSHEWKNGASRLTWVRHGVALATEHGTLPNYTFAVASADDLTVDLSQFSVVRDAHYTQVIQRLTAAAVSP